MKDLVQSTLNEIKEDEKIENSISKLSTIFEKTLNIFFEIPIISENTKKEINVFLDNLSKWFIGRLNGIISDLINQNSNELSILLFNEQNRVKKNHNVQKTLSNEKSINDYKIESEHNLKPSITNKVYYLAMKDIYYIISENLVEMSEDVMKEQFNLIIPNLRNNISDKKLKELSNKILQEIIKNK